MNILGIDHSTRSGFAFVNTDTNDIETWQYQMTNKEEGARYKEWYDYLEYIYEDYMPDLVVMEKPAHMRNANISRFLGGLVTIEKLLCAKYNIKTLEVVPTTLKKHLTGNGRSEKQDVAMSLIEHFKGTIKPKDIEEYEYYKKDGSVKKIHYDKSDALALVVYANNVFNKE